MISWLTKYRISSALDANRPLSTKLQRKIERSLEARGFFESATVLGQKLKRPPAVAGISDLHGSIMHSVRAAAHRAQHVHRGLRLTWLPIPLAAAALALGVWALIPPPAAPRDKVLDNAPAALRAGQEFAFQLPTVVTAPLYQEFEQLDTDIRETARFLMASLP